jgi:endonuclease YncB( thermonuclease family)
MSRAGVLALSPIALAVALFATGVAVLLRPGASHTLAAELRPGLSPEEPAVARPVRNVTPDDMTAPPAAAGPYVRVTPAASSPQATTPPPKPPTMRLSRPLVMSAGTLKAGGRVIRLAGVEAPGFAERCGAEAWPCGRMARAALARFVRGRAVECVLPPGADAIPDPADCRVAGRSLSAWLVAQGWARATSAAYEEAEGKARSGALGIWAETRPGGAPPASAQPAASPASSPDSALAIKARVSDTP